VGEDGSQYPNLPLTFEKYLVNNSLRNNLMQDSDVVFKMKGKKLFITDELEKF
jgi:hypothetical protein